MSKIEEQYNSNIQAFKKLELTFPTSLDEVKKLLTPTQKSAITKGKGQLVISPAITTKFTFSNLIQAYKKHYDVQVWGNLWDQYEQDLVAPASINVIDLTIGNNYKDPITQHTNLPIHIQRNTKREFLNPAEAIILNTILKQENKNLAPNTFIRFPQLSNKTVVGLSVVGDVHSYGGQLRFSYSNGDGFGYVGVGFSVGQRHILNTSSFNSSFELKKLTDSAHATGKAEAIEKIKNFLEKL